MPRQLVWTLLPALLLGVTGCGVLGAQSIRIGMALFSTE